MAISTGSRHGLAYVAESTYGTTPSTPTLKTLRHTTCTIGVQKDAIQSEELREDRQISDFRHGNKTISGEIGAELSYTNYQDLLEAVLGGTWASDVLKAGTTRRSFTFERDFSDQTNRYHRFTGCEVSSLSLSVQPNAMVGATFGILGQGNDAIASGTVAGATYSAADVLSPFDSFTGTVLEGGTTAPEITSVELNIDNGMNPLFIVGSTESLQPSIGRSNITGTMSVYFDNTSKVTLEKFLNETETSIQFTLVDLAGNTLDFELPRIKYSSGQPDVTGEGEIILSLEFQALYNSSDDSNIVITRTDA